MDSNFMLKFLDRIYWIFFSRLSGRKPGNPIASGEQYNLLKKGDQIVNA
jgi:hypothetical protein